MSQEHLKKPQNHALTDVFLKGLSYDEARWSCNTDLTYLTNFLSRLRALFDYLQAAYEHQNHRTPSLYILLCGKEDRLKKYFFISEFWAPKLGGIEPPEKLTNPDKSRFWRSTEIIKFTYLGAQTELNGKVMTLSTQTSAGVRLRMVLEPFGNWR